MTAPRPVRLLVCGNGDRGDDGAALAAVSGLLATLPPHLLAVLEVRRCEQLDLEDLIDLPSSTACVVADAVVGVAPGQVVTMPLAELAALDGGAGPVARSSHVLPIGHLVAIAQLMREQPVEGSFVGIGAKSFEFGRPLSRDVRAGLPAYRAVVASALMTAAAAHPLAIAPA